MGAKVTQVRLSATDCDRTRVFPLEEAEKILRQPNCCWVVAEGEKVEYTSNGFRCKSNSRRVQATEQAE